MIDQLKAKFTDKSSIHKIICAHQIKNSFQIENYWQIFFRDKIVILQQQLIKKGGGTGPAKPWQPPDRKGAKSAQFHY